MSLMRVADFLVQQVLSTIGVLILAGMIVFSSAPLIRWIDPDFSPSTALTETHYFPVQVLIALSVGILVTSRVRTMTGLWMWGIPAAILAFAVMVKAFSSPSSLGTLSSHFFGNACLPRNRCFDQLALTLPFYAACAYSLGSFFAWRWVRSTT